jgi:hypothetical protein
MSDRVSIYDIDGSLLAEIKTEQQPEQVVRSTHQPEVGFVVVYKSHVSSYRLSVDKESAQLVVSEEWSRSLDDLHISGAVKGHK